MYKLSILFISLWMISCHTENKNETKQIFRLNRYDNVSSLDPAFAKNQSNIWMCNQLFSGLVQLDDNMEVKPDIAKSWTISEDGLTYDFTLRKAVFFHKDPLFGKDSTRRVNAQDFEYSLGRLKDKKTASPGGWVLNNVESYHAKNDSVFSMKLKEAFPPFLGLLSMKYCSVVPKEIVEHYGENFREHPIGTGPFKFKIWVENVKLVMRKNELFYEKDSKGKSLPYLEAVAVTFLPDKQAEFLQLLQGNLDVISGLDASYINELLTAEGSLNPKYKSQLKILKSPYLNTEYLCFYVEDENKAIPKKIRQAINYGFDRKSMVKYLRNNVGIPADGGFIPSGLAGYKKGIGYDYQPEKAKKLIQEYRQEAKKIPPVKIITTADYVDLCEFIQSDLQKIGMNIQVEVIPKPALRQGKSNGKFNFFRASWIADYPDAENYLSLFYSKNFAPNGPNYSHFKSAKFDALFERALKENTIEKRTKLYTKMDSLVMRESAVVPLFYDEVCLTIQKNIVNLNANATNLLNLKNVYKYEQTNSNSPR